MDEQDGTVREPPVRRCRGDRPVAPRNAKTAPACRATASLPWERGRLARIGLFAGNEGILPSMESRMAGTATMPHFIVVLQGSHQPGR